MARVLAGPEPENVREGFAQKQVFQETPETDVPFEAIQI
jgi:hypothetical protein